MKFAFNDKTGFASYIAVTAAISGALPIAAVAAGVAVYAAYRKANPTPEEIEREELLRLGREEKQYEDDRAEAEREEQRKRDRAEFRKKHVPRPLFIHRQYKYWPKHSEYGFDFDAMAERALDQYEQEKARN